MAIQKTDYMTGKKQLPSCSEAHVPYNVIFKIDCAKTPIANGDFIQLMKKPPGVSIADLRMGTDTNFGLTELACGYADALETTSLAKIYIEPQTFTTLDAVAAKSSLMNDSVLTVESNNENILTVEVSVQGQSIGGLYVYVNLKAKQP